MAMVMLRDRADRDRFVVESLSYGISELGILWWLELAGSPQAVKACWAHMASMRDMRKDSASVTGLTIQTSVATRLSVRPKDRYMTIWKGLGQVMFLHPDFSRTSNLIFFGPSDNSLPPWFGAAISRHIDIPFRDSWLPYLWDRANHRSLIQRAKHFSGPQTAWQLVHTSGRLAERATGMWQEIVKRGLEDGTLS